MTDATRERAIEALASEAPRLQCAALNQELYGKSLPRRCLQIGKILVGSALVCGTHAAQARRGKHPLRWWRDPASADVLALKSLTSSQLDALAQAQLEVVPAGTMELLGKLFGFVESGTLVRNIEHDGEPDFARRQIPLVSTLGKVARLLHPEWVEEPPRD